MSLLISQIWYGQDCLFSPVQKFLRCSSRATSGNLFCKQYRVCSGAEHSENYLKTNFRQEMEPERAPCKPWTPGVPVELDSWIMQWTKMQYDEGLSWCFLVSCLAGTIQVYLKLLSQIRFTSIKYPWERWTEQAQRVKDLIFWGKIVPEKISGLHFFKVLLIVRSYIFFKKDKAESTHVSFELKMTTTALPRCLCLI